MKDVSKEITVRLHNTPRGLRIGLYHNGRIIGMVQADGLDLIPGYWAVRVIHPRVSSDHTWFSLHAEGE